MPTKSPKKLYKKQKVAGRQTQFADFVQKVDKSRFIALKVKNKEREKGECYSDDETGLYGQSPLYVFNLFLQEMQTKNKKKGKADI